MELHIAEWGNSLAIRIPRAMAKKTGLKKGSAVNAEIEDGRIIIEPEISDDILEANDRFLKDLAGNLNWKAMLAKITPENQPDREDFDDGPVGKEVW